MTTITINKEVSIIGIFMLILGLGLGLAFGFVGGARRGFEGGYMMRGYGYNTGYNNTGYNTPGYGMMRFYQQGQFQGTQPVSTTTPVAK